MFFPNIPTGHGHCLIVALFFESFCCWFYADIFDPTNHKHCLIGAVATMISAAISMMFIELIQP
jgi:hypothetical protein